MIKLFKNKSLKNSEETLVIQPTRGWRHINLAEVWRHRELLYFLTWRDVIVRYKQTLIGAAWAVIQPVLTMVIFSIFFGKLVQVPSEGIPYPIFVYAGLLPWMYFSNALTGSTVSVVASVNLVRKVYFPRLIVPASSALARLVDFGISFLVLFALMFYYRFPIGWGVLLLPLLVLLTLLAAIGTGLWCAGINALYRDVGYAIPFVIRLGMFLTPVIYPVSIVGEKWKWVLYLNPMTGLIETYRATLLGYKPIPLAGLAMSCGIILFLFISGIFYFKRIERIFVDLV